MVSNTRLNSLAHLLLISAAAFCASISCSAQEPSKPRPSLDYEFYKTRVEPIFLKKRWPDHARCYVCHEVGKHLGGPLSLELLSPGKSTWTDEQSRANFKAVSKVVIPGNPLGSLLLLRPLAPEAGGLGGHQGGRQFRSQDDPDWKIIAAWIRGEKADSSAP